MEKSQSFGINNRIVRSWSLVDSTRSFLGSISSNFEDLNNGLSFFLSFVLELFLLPQ